MKRPCALAALMRWRPLRLARLGRWACLIALAALLARPAYGQGTTGNVLFRDDFGTYSNRWTTLDTPKATVVRQSEMLRMTIASPGVFAWSTPDFAPPVGGYRIHAVAVFHGGSEDARAGLVLDYRDEGNLWAWLVARDGSWQLWQRAETEWEDITPADALPGAAQGRDAVLYITAEIWEGWVSFSVGGTPVGHAMLHEGAEAGGAFGLAARAGRGYVDVSFDDVLVTALIKDGRS